MYCFVTYSKGKTPRRPGLKKASNIEKDPVGVSEQFTLLFQLKPYHSRRNVGIMFPYLNPQKKVMENLS